MKHTLYRIVTKVTIFATVFLTVLGAITPSAYAAATAFDSVLMQLSRVQASTITSSTFTINLPDSGTGWDATTASDTISITFATGTNNWTIGANWTGTDFTILDGSTSVTVSAGNVATSATAGTQPTYNACLTAGNDYATVFVNSADRKFWFRRCGGGGGTAPNTNGGNIIITIESGGTGSITTPAAGNNYLVTLDMADEDTLYDITRQVATSIIASDAAGPSGVQATAPTLTFVVAQDTTGTGGATCSGFSAITATTTFGFNTLVSTQVNNATSTICTTVSSTNSSLTVRVYISSQYGGLNRSSGSNFINNAGTGGSAYSSATQKTLTVGTNTDDGICVMDSGDTGASDTGTITSISPYNGTCNYTSMTGTETLGTIPTLATGGLQPVWTATVSSNSAATHLLPRVAISAATTAGTYTDTYYITAAATF
ncbi:hypothetical protein HYW94_00235 [Candidatus Uhrbacteria bacterium]|nr:hypothetical protein [Candidatus Uhrbacteria bacterium]